MKTRHLFLSTVAALAVCGSTMAQPATNDSAPKDKKEKSNAFPARGQQGSGFTEEQRTKMKEYNMALYKEVQPLRNQLKELRAKSHTLETAEKADLKAINANIDEITKLENQIRKAEAANTQKVRALLTDEQRMKFDSPKQGGGRQLGASQNKFRGEAQGRGFGGSPFAMKNGPRAMGQHGVPGAERPSEKMNSPK